MLKSLRYFKIMFLILVIISMVTLTNALVPLPKIEVGDDKIKDVISKYIENIPDIEEQYVVDERISRALSHYFKGKISSFPLYKVSVKIDRNPIKIPWSLSEPEVAQVKPLALVKKNQKENIKKNSKVNPKMLNVSPKMITKVISKMNPKVNSNANPKVKSKVIPKLNPKVNSKVISKENITVNPKENTTVNITENTTVNPNINGKVNPKINLKADTKVNPEENSKVNPTENPKDYPTENSKEDSKATPKENLKEDPKSNPKADPETNVKNKPIKKRYKFIKNSKQDGETTTGTTGKHVEKNEIPTPTLPVVTTLIASTINTTLQ